MSHHQTLAAPGRFELEVRKSRHLAVARAAPDPASALAFVEHVSDPAANHNCWAYRIGSAYRFSDDGEPSGTAGRPILAAIQGQALDQVVVVVTRWFGGIKLGAGGLMRAYGGAAAECLRQAPRRALVDWREATLEAGFELTASVHGLLDAFGAIKLDETYTSDGVRVHVRIPAQQLDPLAEALADASRGQAALTPLDEVHPREAGTDPR